MLNITTLTEQWSHNASSYTEIIDTEINYWGLLFITFF